MTEPNGSSDELDPVYEVLVDRLRALRPFPRPAFRGALRRHLVIVDPGYGPRPANLRTFVALWIVAGLLLLALGAVVAVGII